MRTPILLTSLLLFSRLLHAEPTVAAAPIKVFKGQEGERVTLLEIDNSRRVLVETNDACTGHDGRVNAFKYVKFNRSIMESIPGSENYFERLAYESPDSKQADPVVFGVPVYYCPKDETGFIRKIRLTYSEELSKSASASRMLRQYEKQKDN